MNFATGLIIGLIIGWLIEWAIDWLYWRSEEGAEATINKLEAELDEAESKLDTQQKKLADAEQTIDNLRAELEQATIDSSKKEDRLERVKGIGAVFAKRLNKAGIHTFAELAKLSPDRIREIINPEEWQKIQPEQWIAQAQELAQESEADQGA